MKPSRPSIQVNPSVIGIVWNPQSDWLAAWNESGIWFCNDKFEYLFSVQDSVDSVKDVNWSRDGKQIIYIAVVYDVVDEHECTLSIRIADSASGQLIATLFDIPNIVIYSVNWSPDNTRIAATIGDSVRIWDATSKELVWNLAGHEQVSPYWHWSWDSKYILSYGYDSKIYIWDTISGKAVNNFINADRLFDSVCWHPHRNVILIPDSQGQMKCWDVEKQEYLYGLEGQTERVFQISYSNDGEFLAGIDVKDGHVNIWATSNGQLLLKRTEKLARSVLWRPQSNYLAILYWDGSGDIWNQENDRIIGSFQLPDRKIKNAWWSPDGNKFAVQSDYHDLFLWSVSSSGLKQIMSGNEVSDWLNCVAWKHDQTQLALGFESGELILWDLDGNTHTNLNSQHRNQNARCINAIAWNSDDVLVASGGDDGVIEILDTEKNNIINIFTQKGRVETLAWSSLHDERLRATTRFPETALIIDHKSADIISFEYSGLASAWDGATNNLAIATLDTDQNNYLIELSIINRDRGALEKYYLGNEAYHVHTIEWSFDGQFLALGCENGSILIWSTRDSKIIKELKHHRKYVGVIKWHPNNMWLISGGGDHTVCVWDVNKSNPKQIIYHPSWIVSLCWSDAGDEFLSASSAGTIEFTACELGE